MSQQPPQSICFYSAPLPLSTIPHRLCQSCSTCREQQLATCAGGTHTLLWGRQICPLGIPHGTGSFRDSPCSSCNVLWHVLPGEVCKSRYLSCWYLLSVLLQLVRVGVGRAPVMGCQHMQQFIHPGCDCCIGPAPGTLNQPCPKPKPLPLSNSSSRTNVHCVQCLHLLFPQVQAEITAVSSLLQRTC